MWELPFNSNALAYTSGNRSGGEVYATTILKYKSKRMQEWVAPLLAELDESHRQPALAS
jgi:hypothetical protein